MPNHPPPIANGRYTLSSPLGQGGMATVYGGFDTMLEVERAVKVLSPALCSNEKVRRRFLAEARAMAKLRHPNIVTIFDVGIEGETPFIVMEKVDGGAVMDWIDRDGPQSDEVAGHIMLGVLAGLQASHDRGIVHRDIKPHNMLLSQDGLVKITDYGIANVAEDERSFTKTGAIMGTLAYMPPEQRQSAKGLGPTADVFAAGASMYAIITGSEPFDLYNESLHERLFEGISQPMRRVIVKACHYDATERYESASAMSRAIRECMAELGIAVAQDFRISLDGGDRADGTMFFDGEASTEAVRPAPENTTINPMEMDLGPTSDEEPYRFWTTQGGDEGAEKRSKSRVWTFMLVTIVVVATLTVFVKRSSLPDDGAALPAAQQVPAPPEAAAAPNQGTVAVPAPPEVVPPEVAPPEAAEASRVAEPAAKPKREVRTPPPVIDILAPEPTVAKAEQSVPPEPAPSSTAPGRLSVNAVPPAVVTIDGQNLGLGMVRGHPLSPGSHQLVLSTPDGRVKTKTVQIQSGKNSVICWNFELNDICPR